MIAPRENPLLVGQEAAEGVLLEAMRSGRLHHAWLISGPAGVGKATLAFRFARRLLAGVGEGTSLALAPAHPVFRRVAARTHADMETLELEVNEKTKRMRTEIIVDQVRDKVEFLHRTPAEGGWRVLVVDGADRLNRNAANALLKVLEEPPARAVLLLTCDAPGQLLPTIRSRCRVLRLPRLADPVLLGLLEQTLPTLSAAERRRLAYLAEGSPGRAMMLAAEVGGQLVGLVSDVLEGLPQIDLARAHGIADLIGRSEGGFSTFMDLLRTVLAQAVRAAGRGEGGRLGDLRPLDAWVEVWQGLNRLQFETENFNLDKRQALIQGLSLLRGS